MAEQFYTILTNVGKAKIANATALGTKLNLTTFAVGDGNGAYYDPTEAQLTLKNEVWRGSINAIEIDEQNSNWVVITTLIPSTIGGFNIREAGIFDTEGNLIAIGKYPQTYKPVVDEGSSKDLYIKLILEVTSTTSVTLKVDPTVIVATKQDVQNVSDKLDTHSSVKATASSLGHVKAGNGLAIDGDGVIKVTDNVQQYKLTNSDGNVMVTLSGVDFNLYTQAGYYLVSGTTFANGPAATLYGTLQVIRRANTNIVQIYISNGNGQMQIRSNSGSGWSAWDIVPMVNTDFGHSIGANGYQKFPGGLILQWGTVTVTSGATATFTFPAPFLNTVTSYSLQNFAPVGGTTNATLILCSGLTKTAMNIVNNSSTSATVKIIALGY